MPFKKRLTGSVRCTVSMSTYRESFEVPTNRDRLLLLERRIPNPVLLLSARRTSAGVIFKVQSLPIDDASDHSCLLTDPSTLHELGLQADAIFSVGFSMPTNVAYNLPGLL